jgi:hypothetical protein
MSQQDNPKPYEMPYDYRMSRVVTGQTQSTGVNGNRCPKCGKNNPLFVTACEFCGYSFVSKRP